MSTESDITAYRRKKQTEKMLRYRELARQQKQAASRVIAKESKYVQEMRKQIAEEIRRIKEEE